MTFALGGQVQGTVHGGTCPGKPGADRTRTYLDRPCWMYLRSTEGYPSPQLSWAPMLRAPRRVKLQLRYPAHPTPGPVCPLEPPLSVFPRELFPPQLVHTLCVLCVFFFSASPAHCRPPASTPPIVWMYILL